jgi:hypothetical protein
LLHEQPRIGRGRRQLVDEAEALQILRCDRERNEVADRFVEPVVRAFAE